MKHPLSRYAPSPLEYPIARYRSEVERLRRLLDRTLAEHEYLADEYSIADIACAPWLKMFALGYPNEAPYPHLDAWLERVFARPAVQRGLMVPAQR